MYTVLPFGPVNAPPFYTAMVRQFQAEWNHLFQLYCNNKSELVNSDTSQPQPQPIAPNFPRSHKENEFRKLTFLPAFEIDAEHVLNGTPGEGSPQPRETYTACTTIKHRTKDSKHEIVTGS